MLRPQGGWQLVAAEWSVGPGRRARSFSRSSVTDRPRVQHVDTEAAAIVEVVRLRQSGTAGAVAGLQRHSVLEW